MKWTIELYYLLVFWNHIINKGIARTQSPTIKNYALELPTFGVIVGVSLTGVQWRGLTLEEPPSWSWLTSAPGKYAQGWHQFWTVESWIQGLIDETQEKTLTEENIYEILACIWKREHAFHLVYNYCVCSMNSPIQYPPVGHLAAPFTTNAATWGETFQNGDFFLFASAPYTVDSPLAILNTVSTDFVAFLAKMN